MNKSLKILMVTESNFPNDIRVRNEAKKLINASNKVFVIALRFPGQNYYEYIYNIHVLRIPKLEIFKNYKQNQSSKNSCFSKIKGIIGYGIEYFYFTIISFLLSIYLLAKFRIDIVHTHNPPDTLVVTGCLFKILRKYYVFDQHDLSSDLFKEKYGENETVIYQLLKFIEFLSFKLCDYAIVTNNSYREIAIQRNKISEEKIVVVRNGPDLEEFNHVQGIGRRNGNSIIVCYVGAINYQDGLDNLVLIADIIIKKKKFKKIKFLIIGDGDYLDSIKNLVKTYKIESYFIFTGYIYDKNILNKLIIKSDICVDTAKLSFYNNNSTFIKNMEYMVFNKPTVSFALKESMYTLKNAGVFIEPDNYEQFADEIIRLAMNEKLRKNIGKNGNERLKYLNWNVVSVPLMNVYEEIRQKNYR